MKKIKKGDTIIEVMISMAVFSMVAVISVTLMNNGLNTAQRSLEITMARLAIDAQADTLDFIRSGAISENGKTSNSEDYTYQWNKILDKAKFATEVNTDVLDLHDGETSCGGAISRVKSTFGDSLFALNPRGVIPVPNDGSKLLYATKHSGGSIVEHMDKDSFLVENVLVNVNGVTRGMIGDGGLYPRIIYAPYYGTKEDKLTSDAYYTYRKVDQVQNIWMVAIKEGSDDRKSKYYDFYIQTCWESPGMSTFVTLSTIKRIYNPEAKL